MLARFSALLALIATALTVTASPAIVRNSPVTLPVARRVKEAGMVNLLAQDQARAKILKSRSQGQAKNETLQQAAIFNVPGTNQAEDYVVSVGVGSPPTYYSLLVDTGSSNTWIGADLAYKPTSTSHDEDEIFLVEYGSGLVFGQEYTDTVTLGDLVLEEQGLGVATIAIGFNGVDGILGIGPVDLTEGTTGGGGAIPTVVNTAFSQGLISSEVIGISFEPAISASVANGELTFGGVDSTKYTGTLAYVPITSTSPASEYVGIDQSVIYGSAGTTILKSTAGITDTGTTLILLASDALAAYQKATGAVSDSATGLLKLTAAQYANLQSLYFNIGGVSYELTPNAQIWPRSLNSYIGGTATGIYLIVADLGTDSGEGLDFINGFSFLERFYYVYDVANSQVGFATTSFTNATTN